MLRLDAVGLCGFRKGRLVFGLQPSLYKMVETWRDSAQRVQRTDIVEGKVSILGVTIMI